MGRGVVGLSTVLCLAGVVVDAYLTLLHYVSSVPLVCDNRGAINCAKVLSSPESRIIGVPVAALGLAYFCGMVALCSPWGWRIRHRLVGMARRVGVWVSMAMVLWLIHAELLDIRAICLFCTATHVIAFALFLTVLAAGRPERVTASPEER